MNRPYRLCALLILIGSLAALTGCGTTKPAPVAGAPQLSRSEAMDIVKKEAALGYSLRGKMKIAYAYVSEVTDSGFVLTIDRDPGLFEGIAVELVKEALSGTPPPYTSPGTVMFDDVYEVAKMRGGGWINIHAHQKKQKIMMTTQATKNVDQLLAALHVLCPNAK